LTGASSTQTGGKTGGRIHTMDEVRGLCVVLMVIYHAFYTTGYLFGFSVGRDFISFFSPAEPFIASVFILISGISSNLSRSNVKRGAKLLLVAAAVTLVTVFITPQGAIYFGILHFLSIAMLLFGLLQKAMGKIPLGLGLAACAVLYFITYGIPQGFLGIPGLLGVSLPNELYQTEFLFFLGFKSPHFFSADYFPLLPHIFTFLFGTFLGRLALSGRFPRALYKKRVPPLSFIGRHALIIYILHQPVIYGACLLVSLFVK